MDNSTDILDKSRTTNPFVVPEGYFDHLPADIMQRVDALNVEQTLEIKNFSTWDRMKPYIYLAAMFVGFMCMFSMFDNLFPAQEAEAVADIESVLAADDWILSSMDVYTIYEFLESE